MRALRSVQWPTFAATRRSFSRAVRRVSRRTSTERWATRGAARTQQGCKYCPSARAPSSLKPEGDKRDERDAKWPRTVSPASARRPRPARGAARAQHSPSRPRPSFRPQHGPALHSVRARLAIGISGLASIGLRSRLLQPVHLRHLFRHRGLAPTLLSHVPQVTYTFGTLGHPASTGLDGACQGTLVNATLQSTDFEPVSVFQESEAVGSFSVLGGALFHLHQRSNSLPQ